MPSATSNPEQIEKIRKFTRMNFSEIVFDDNFVENINYIVNILSQQLVVPTREIGKRLGEETYYSEENGSLYLLSYVEPMQSFIAIEVPHDNWWWSWEVSLFGDDMIGQA